MILKHLELWSHMNDPATYKSYPDVLNGLFADRVDMTKISLSGHSRGGEASVSAYIQNRDRAPPDKFKIVAVSSIAPTDALVYSSR